MAATPPPSAPGGPEPPPTPLQYSLLLQHLVGEKRQPRAWDPAALGGIPSPPKSEEQKMVERAMESCAFKAALACVGGAAGAAGGDGGGWRDGVVVVVSPMASVKGWMGRCPVDTSSSVCPRSRGGISCLPASLAKDEVCTAFPQHSTGWQQGGCQQQCL